MKSRFILFMILGLWILGISACGKEEAVNKGALMAGGGSAFSAGDSLADVLSSRREDGAEKEKAEKGSGKGQQIGGEDSDHGENLKSDSASEGEAYSEENGGVPEGEAGSEENGGVPEGEAGSERNGGVPEGEAGSEKNGPVSGGKDGTEKNGTGNRNGAVQTAAVGGLFVDGTKLVDGEGNAVQLKGISTHGLAWYPDYVNEDCVRQLREEWGMNVLRLAMYTAEYGGYCSGGDKDDLKTLVKEGVGYATDNDMYVIIDWHILSDGNPNTYLEDAKGFFQEMSEEYADYTNVLYEICNEPNGGTSWSDIKSYAEQVIGVIRENDEDGIILVGTPNWSQYVEQAAADPIEGYDNIMYTLHFYAATHKEDLRQAMVRAVEAGLPIFVSEYGICDASGSGGIDEYQANQWVELLDQYQISYVAWNLSNKSETSAVIKSSCAKISGFTQEDLSDSGKWLYNMLGAQGTPETAVSGGEGQKEAGSGGSVPPEATSGSGGQEAGSGAAGGRPGADVGGGQGEAGSEAPVQSGSDAIGGGQGEAGSGAAWQGGTVTQGELSLSVQPVNSWEQGGESFCQYTLTITNLGETDEEGWTVQVTFSADIALSNGWNGNYQANGCTLEITSMDYNGHIDKGGRVENVGFIVQSQKGLTLADG